jgi:hypothetical protein
MTFLEACLGQLFLCGAVGNLPLVSTLSLCSLRSLDGGHYAREKCRVLLGAAGGLTTHTLDVFSYRCSLGTRPHATHGRLTLV